MHLLLLLLPLLLAASCGVETGSTGTAPPSKPPAPVPRCARMVGSGFFDDKLGTPCTFGVLDSHRVCIPNNMPKVISGMCDPKGGPDRIWIDRAGCGGSGTSRYVLSSNTKSCGDMKGPIEVIADTVQLDQNVYLAEPQTHACTPSGLTANPTSPIVDRAPPPAPFYLYAPDLPDRPCAAR